MEILLLLYLLKKIDQCKYNTEDGERVVEMEGKTPFLSEKNQSGASFMARNAALSYGCMIGDVSWTVQSGI